MRNGPGCRSMQVEEERACCFSRAARNLIKSVCLGITDDKRGALQRYITSGSSMMNYPSFCALRIQFQFLEVSRTLEQRRHLVEVLQSTAVPLPWC